MSYGLQVYIGIAVEISLVKVGVNPFWLRLF